MTGRSDRLWLRVYHVLLWLYPRAVRRQFGADMQDCFRDLRKQARGRGRRAEISFVLRTLGDLPRSALKAHIERFRRRKTPLRPDHTHRSNFNRRNGLGMESVLHDIRFALRGFRKHPGFAILAVLSLALGVGANTTMISTVNALLWRELPVPEQDRIVRVYEHRDLWTNFSYPNFSDLRDQRDVFDGMFLHSLQTFGLGTDEGTQVVYGESVSASYFEVLRIEPALGRFFSAPESDDANAPPVIVIGHALWQRVFGGDPSVIGRVVRINNEPTTIVAVAPEGFDGTKTAVAMDAWIPAKIWARMAGWGNWTEQRGLRNMDAVARLRDGVTIEQAQEAVTVLASHLEEEYPGTNRRSTFGVFPANVLTAGATDLQKLISIFAIGASSLVLLVACANVASLLFARGAIRAREVGVRVALGASRSRIVRQLLTESVILAFIGGAVGTALAFWSAGFIKFFLPSIPYRFAITARPDTMVLGIAVAVSAAAAFVFGLLPALQTTKPNIAAVVKADATGAGTGAVRSRMLNGVVVSMVALSFVTLLLSALFTTSLRNVRETHPGFATDQRLLALFSTGLGGYDGSDALGFFTQLEDRVRGLPGVRRAAFASHMPLGDRQNNSRVFATDLTYEPDDIGIQAWRSSVTPGYFAAAGTQIIRGRDFDRRDDADAPRSVIINETIATMLWRGANPIGKRLRYSLNPGSLELAVVGVVENGPLAQVGEAPRAAMFSPLAQVPRTYASLVVHAEADPLNLVTAIRSEARAIDPGVPMSDVKTMEVHLTGSLWLFRMGAGLGSALGFLALALASAGLYGVMSFAVGQRIRELGIRIALGADHRRVMFLVLKRGLILAGMGVAIGAVASVGLAGMLSNLLVGVQPTDPAILAAVGIGLGVVALLASLVPARSAMKADPVEALRTE